MIWEARPMPQSANRLLPLVARIVCAQVGHNVMPTRAIAGLIRDVYDALAGVDGRTSDAGASPASPRKGTEGQTVFANALVCLECGSRMKMLKRHLQTVHNETPAQYRAKWRLAGDYPMVAREYAELRSSLAKESGLGKRPSSRRA
jgi:predicted transcriptional regulator